MHRSEPSHREHQHTLGLVHLVGIRFVFLFHVFFFPSKRECYDQYLQLKECSGQLTLHRICFRWQIPQSPLQAYFMDERDSQSLTKLYKGDFH